MTQIGYTMMSEQAGPKQLGPTLREQVLTHQPVLQLTARHDRAAGHDAGSARPPAHGQGATAASVIVLMPAIRAVRSSASWWRDPSHAGSR